MEFEVGISNIPALLRIQSLDVGCGRAMAQIEIAVKDRQSHQLKW